MKGVMQKGAGGKAGYGYGEDLYGGKPPGGKDAFGGKDASGGKAMFGGKDAFGKDGGKFGKDFGKDAGKGKKGKDPSGGTPHGS